MVDVVDVGTHRDINVMSAMYILVFILSKRAHGPNRYYNYYYSDEIAVVI